MVDRVVCIQDVVTRLANQKASLFVLNTFEVESAHLDLHSCSSTHSLHKDTSENAEIELECAPI